MADFIVAVRRDLTKDDLAVLESRGYRIGGTIGPGSVAYRESTLDREWRDAAGSSVWRVDLCAYEPSDACSRVAAALGLTPDEADDALRAYEPDASLERVPRPR